MPSIKSNKRWEEENDLRTLTEAQEIQSDKKRMAAIKEAIGRVLKEKEREVNIIKQITRKKPAVRKVRK